MNLRLFKDGDVFLTKISTPILKISDKHRKLAYYMHKAMLEWNGVGLSAVQVGRPIRLIVINAAGTKRTMFNPVITNMSDVKNKLEGCLSFPGVFKSMPRPETISVSFQDVSGVSVTEIFTGLVAQVVIHECFHLDGITLSHKSIDKPESLLYTVL